MIRDPDPGYGGQKGTGDEKAQDPGSQIRISNIAQLFTLEKEHWPGSTLNYEFYIELAYLMNSRGSHQLAVIF